MILVTGGVTSLRQVDDAQVKREPGWFEKILPNIPLPCPPGSELRIALPERVGITIGKARIAAVGPAIVRAAAVREA